MENEQAYYFITVFEGYDKNWPRDCRCCGFYTEFKDALMTVRNNVTDLWETCYNYAVIEEYYEGIGWYTGHRWFFKYNRQKDEYESIDEPEELKHICNFALG